MKSSTQEECALRTKKKRNSSTRSTLVVVRRFGPHANLLIHLNLHSSQTKSKRPLQVEWQAFFILYIVDVWHYLGIMSLSDCDCDWTYANMLPFKYYAFENVCEMIWWWSDSKVPLQKFVTHAHRSHLAFHSLTLTRATYANQRHELDWP